LPPVTGADAILVHPNCLGDAPTRDNQRDLMLFDALLTRIESTYCVDQARVFAAGHGSGAFFVSALGCIRGNVLRGIAPLSASAPPTGPCSGEMAVWISLGNLDMAFAAGKQIATSGSRETSATRPCP
jgi:poly(3-hydroxybutyrate) depolymerase